MERDSEPDRGTTTDVVIHADWPKSLRPFGDGYPATGDPCRRVGESEATNNFLDDSAVLVGCPNRAYTGSLGGKIVGEVDGITLVSIPSSAAAQAATRAPSSVPTSKDGIRGKGGLEEKCAARVAEVTRAPVLGTNRIEESQSSVEVYVNVEGAQAPWRCVGKRDGSISRVEYSGSEGEL